MKKRSPPSILADEHFIRLRRTGWAFETTSKHDDGYDFIHFH
jgi:hypothetical protein